jgi:hypothetical protein
LRERILLSVSGGDRGVDYGQAVAHSPQRGKPQAFHQTITIAFLSLIAERIESGGAADFADFAQANPDLLEKSVLSRWYRAERLASTAARRTFLLPDPALRGSE